MVMAMNQSKGEVRMVRTNGIDDLTFDLVESVVSAVPGVMLIFHTLEFELPTQRREERFRCRGGRHDEKKSRR